MDETLKLIGTSAVVSAIIGGLVTFLTQNRLQTRKAELDYEFEAKKRLFEAIGPLRLQLLLAARDVVRRFRMHHLSNSKMNPAGYFVKSSVYRLLAPLAVGQLIEKKMSVVDFTVDPQAIELLSFITAVERMLTGSDVTLEHPDIDWSTQSQHIFRDNLRAAAATLIVSEPDSSKRIMDFAEFDARYELPKTDVLKDLGQIFGKCEVSLTENPIFWLRITGYVFACAHLIQSEPAKAIGFTAREVPIDDMILATSDEYIKARLELYKESLTATLNEGF